MCVCMMLPNHIQRENFLCVGGLHHSPPWCLLLPVSVPVSCRYLRSSSRQYYRRGVAPFASAIAEPVGDKRTAVAVAIVRCRCPSPAVTNFAAGLVSTPLPRREAVRAAALALLT